MVNAVICEFNPIHNGHKYLLENVKSDPDEVCVLIMSGNFVQRGEPALFDKYTRAEWALKCGADLVLELPFPWSVSGAEFFARSGINIAEKCCCDRLVFGSGCGSLELLEKAAMLIQSQDYIEYMTACNREGAAEAKFRYLRERLGDSASALDNANDILGIEYIRAIQKNNILKYNAIKRSAAENVTSASNIRTLILSGRISECEKYVPSCIFSEMKNIINSGNIVTDYEKLFNIIFCYFRLADIASPDIYAECGGGVGNRILSASKLAVSGQEMLDFAYTKKYTYSRIKRAALYLSMHVNKEDIFTKCPYSILLASNKRGREHLRRIKLAESFNIITKPADFEKLTDNVIRLNDYLRNADDLYSLVKQKMFPAGEYLRKKPIIL